MSKLSTNIKYLGRTKLGRSILRNNYFSKISNIIWSKLFRLEVIFRNKSYPRNVDKILPFCKSKFVVNTVWEEDNLLNDYEEDELLNRIYNCRKEDMVYYDLGANVGLTSIPLSDYCKTIYSIEPNPNSVKLLKKNISTNKVKNIKIFQKGVSDKIGEFDFFLGHPESHSPHSSLSGVRHSIQGDTELPYSVKVKLVTLDKLIVDNDLLPPDVIKIDIEGAEFHALKGMKETIRKFKPYLFIEVHPRRLIDFGTSEKEFLRYIKKIGYLVENLRYRRLSGYKIYAYYNLKNGK